MSLDERLNIDYGRPEKGRPYNGICAADGRFTMKRGPGGLLRAFFGIKIPLLAFIIICGLAVGVTYGVTVRSERDRIGSGANYDQAMKYLEIKNTIDQNYVGEVDEEAVSSSAFAAMVDGLGDKWSYYMSPSEYAAYKLYSANQYTGLGVSIDKDAETGGFKVLGVSSGSPADNAGIKAGHIILSVADKDLTNMTVGDARSFISANLSRSVSVTLINLDGDQHSLTVDCTLVYTNPVSYEIKNGEIGYVKIASFDSGSAELVIKAVESLLEGGAQRFVFDVRSNPGGLYSEMVEVLDYLLPSGDILVSVNESGEETVERSDNVCLSMPMVVIVNSDTYAAAEFFAAALQDYNWAGVVGERTTGKGRIQTTIELSDGSAIHISNGKYLTPNRVDLTEQGGLRPDNEVALTSSGDAQLDAALADVLLR